MLSFPNAKINIGLNVLSKREDGYHNIDSCMYPVPWRDVLEIIPADKFKFSQTGLAIEGDQKENLCVKAYHSLKEPFDLPPVEIHLHKVIPTGAGLGGGSSDGAFTLRLLNRIFDLGLGIDELEKYASKLGSDCPFFIQNMPKMASGRGTELKPINLDLANYYIAIICPEIHVSTEQAYSGIGLSSPDSPLSKRLSRPINEWKSNVTNDFESSIFPEYPDIKEIKSNMYQKGAVFASMSGSGSAVYGLFKKEPRIEEKPGNRVFIKLLEKL